MLIYQRVSSASTSSTWRCKYFYCGEFNVATSFWPFPYSFPSFWRAGAELGSSEQQKAQDLVPFDGRVATLSCCWEGLVSWKDDLGGEYYLEPLKMVEQKLAKRRWHPKSDVLPFFWSIKSDPLGGWHPTCPTCPSFDTSCRGEFGMSITLS